MPITTIADDDPYDDPREAEHLATIGNNIPGDAINFAPPLEQGPTPPVRWSVKERAQLVAERSWVHKLRRLFSRQQLGGR